MNNEQLHRDLGKLEGTVAALSAKIDGIESKLDGVLARQYRFAGGASLLSAAAAFLAAWVAR